MQLSQYIIIMPLLLIQIRNANTKYSVEQLENLENNLQSLRQELIDKPVEDGVTDYRQLSSKETVRRMAYILNKIDTNKDGILSSKELSNWIKKVEEFLEISEVLAKWENGNPKKLKEIHWNDYKQQKYPDENIDHILNSNDESEMRNQYRRWHLVDYNHDGNLTLREFYYFIHPQKLPFLRGVINFLENTYPYDRNGDGILTFVEYVESRHSSKFELISESEKKMYGARFNKFDLNHDLQLDISEQKGFFGLCTYPEPTPLQKAHYIQSTYDMNGNGILTYQEFLAQYSQSRFSHLTGFGEILVRVKEFEEFKCLKCICN